MAIIASIDGATRRVYLDASTVGTSINPIDIYKEMRALRRTDESLRKYNLFMKADGNVPKGPGKATERYVTLLEGTRIVPFDTSHEITITGTIITDAGTEGIDCFDKAPLSVTTFVDINYIPPQVEVITVTGGSGLDAGQDTKLTRIHALLNVIENGMDHSDIMRILLAAMAGRVNGADTGTIRFRDNANTKDRIVADVDGNGNRTMVILDDS